jgi:hypothetical protein
MRVRWSPFAERKAELSRSERRRMRWFLACVLVLALCTSISTGRGEDAITEGEPDKAEVDQANEKILHEAGLKSDSPALLEFFRKRALSPAQLAELQHAVDHLGSGSFLEREQATQHLLEAGRPALPFLNKVVDSQDLEVRRRARQCLEAIQSRPQTQLIIAAIRLLASRKPAGATAALLGYAPFVDDPLIEKALWQALEQTGTPGEETQALVQALRDQQPARRIAAAHVLARRETSLDLLKPLLEDSEDRVRWTAAEGLILTGHKEAVGTLLDLFRTASPELLWYVECLLFRLAGPSAPAVSLGEGIDQERKVCREAWSRWWEENRDKIDLKAVLRQTHKRGLCLVIALNGYGRNGRIWELGTDRKTRWEMTDVGGPFDALVLPSGRILIAEYNQRRVSERDRSGTVYWEHRTPNGPLCVQRLANGNTFLATNYELLEVTRSGKVVFTFRHPGGNIFWGRRMVNGHIYYGTYNGSMVELDRGGKELRQFSIVRPDQGLINVEVLPNGHFLMPQTRQNKIVELDPRSGKVIWEISVPRPTCVARLPNGNFFVGSHNSNRIMEVDRAGKVLWLENTKGQIFGVRCR